MRAKTENLIRIGEVMFGQQYEYHDDLSVDDMLKPEYFLAIRGRFRTGDRMALLHVTRAGRVKEEQPMRVIEVGADFIELQPCGERFFYPSREEVEKKRHARERMAHARAAKAA